MLASHSKAFNPPGGLNILVIYYANILAKLVLVFGGFGRSTYMLVGGMYWMYEQIKWSQKFCGHQPTYYLQVNALLVA